MHIRNVISLVLAACLCSLPIAAQDNDHLSASEVKSALEQGGGGYVYIEDGNLFAAGNCKAQIPSLAIWTTAGWLNALKAEAKRQFLPFQPKDEDTVRALTIIARGCASGTLAGPVCDSVTRLALVSDSHAEVAVEAIRQESVSQTWHNGFGVQAACAALAARFAVADVRKVQDSRGEFSVAVFDGTNLLKIRSEG